MESRFDKYKNDGKIVSDHIANINNLIERLYKEDNNLIEKEIQDLTRRVQSGNAPTIFQHKIDLLIRLGQCIEEIHRVYNFNKNKAEQAA